jgi:conflict system STAND superfamily ATPase
VSGARSQLLDTPVLDPENPWPGLAPFDEAQAEFFYGRQREVEDLFRRVRLNLLTVLYGQSGLGKTSLVRAALFPRLRTAGLLPVPIRLDYSEGAAPARDQIWQALSSALKAAAVPAPSIGEDQTLWEYFHHRSREKGPVPVLVFDQFEELFTLGTERAGGSGFVRDCLVELAALIENRPPDRVEARFDREPRLVAQYDFDRQDCRVLLSLREDYLAHLHDVSGKIPSITLNNMRLTPLDGPRALEAVEKPGQVKRLIAPGAAEAIVRVVAGARGERPSRAEAGLLEHTGDHRASSGVAPLESLVIDPSLLSLLCRELNQKRQEEGLPAITPELVEANRENILNNFYARCLAGLPEGAQIFIEEDLLTESGFRETLSVDSAVGKLKRRGADAHALTTLVDRRLLHYEQRGTVTRVELTHDVLAPVVRHSRTLRREREAVHEAEARRRRELEENERIAQQARAEAEAKYERSKRQRRVFAGIGLVMAAVAAVAVYEGIQSERNARNAEQSALEAKRNASTADSTAKENARLLAVSENQNAMLQQQQEALRTTAEVATRARGVADAALRNTAAMLGDFCTYGLKVIDRFGDSTIANTELTRAYNSLVELSDTSVDLMIARSPNEACPRQLDARILSASTRLSLTLADTAKARARGALGLTAARNLLRWTDSLSRTVATESFVDLNYNLYFARGDSLSLEAAKEATALLANESPTRNALAFDRRARIYHYGALSLLRLRRPEFAARWVDTGLVIAQQGRARADQNQISLLYTISQLQLRRAEVDTALKQPAEGLGAVRAAVAATRERMRLRHDPSTHLWHARMHGWHAEFAEGIGQYAEAVSAQDSCVAQWALYLGEIRRTDTMVVTAMRAMISANIDKATDLAALGRGDEAVRVIDAAADSAASVLRIRGDWSNQHLLAQVLVGRGDVFERMGRRATADSAYRLAFRTDSLNGVDAGRGTNDSAERGAWQGLRFTADRIVGVLRARARADAAGKGSEERYRILQAGEAGARRYREVQVFANRRILAATPPPGRPAANNALASSLSNLAWLYLLLDRPELGIEAAEETLRLNPGETFVFTNYVNALLLSGRDEDAAREFGRFAGRRVENSDILFQCAARRDINTLKDRGIATERHVGVIARFFAAHPATCPSPAASSTP